MTSPLIQGASGVEGEKLTYASTNENNKEIYTFTANEPVSWSISGGEESLFTIDKDTGNLSFKEAPDYETIKKLNGTTLEFHTNFSTASVGDKFFVEVYNDQNETARTTPITTENFIKYVSDGSYDNTLIHRLVTDFMVQGGGYTWPTLASNESGGYPIRVKSKGEIINEPINSNLMGTIAMAKVSGQPNSATSEWFLNLSDNIYLDSQNEGFSVFGHLLGDTIKNPFLLNNQTTYNVNYSEVSLNIPQLPLNNVQDDVIYNDNYFGIQTISTISQRPSEIENVFNVIVTANDLNGNKSNQYVIVNVKDIQGEVLTGLNGQDTLKGGVGNDVFQGNGGNDTIDGGSDSDIAAYSGNFSNYSFTRLTNSLQITDNRNTSGGFYSDGTDILENIEYIEFADQTVDSSKVDVVKTYSGEFSDYKFYNKGNGKYEIKTDSGYDDITGLPLLTFTGEATTSSFRDISAIVDIKGTFDQVTGLNTDDAKMFRLYNAAFKRLPDADGLQYWIGKYSSGENDERAVASSFLDSAEFKQRYGENVSNESYVETLYVNVLGRDYDQAGYNYWVGNLNNGVETRYELLLGFSESEENQLLFSEMTSFY